MLHDLFKKYQVKISLLITAVIVLFTMINTSFRKDYKSGKIEADAKGYYAYLPAVFIYHDLNFRFFYQIEKRTYHNPNLDYQYLRIHGNKTINKYYAGTALCLAPFFLVGHGITLILEYPADGYSYYYTLMVHIGAFFYLILALIGLILLLRTYSINGQTIALVVFTVVLGTNLFYYVVTEFAMSHVYSFAAITWLCVSIRKYFSTFQGKQLIVSGFLLGLIILIRPVNILILAAIPFLAGSSEQFFSGIKSLSKHKLYLFIASVPTLLLIMIQLIAYKLSTGSYIVYSYKEEGFNFLNPQIFNFLISYRKGMFIYTPVLFLSLAGFVYLFRKSRFQFYSLLAFLFILTYVFSSWHMWFYGGSFSQRVMIEFYAFFAILLAVAMQNIRKNRLKNIYISLIILLVLVCQIQTYQYRRNQIHWSDMDKEKYWNVFMRIDKL
jgi:hypothetical protein